MGDKKQSIMRTKIRGFTYTFESAADASVRCAHLREYNEWTEKNWPYPILRAVPGYLVGHVRHNGHVYEGLPKDWTPQTKRLYPL